MLISAFPCMGKTTITNLNRDRCFDLELYETRATMGMKDMSAFFRNCAANASLIVAADYYDYNFVTDDHRFIQALNEFVDLKDVIFEFPDVTDEAHVIEHWQRIIKRNGEDWWERIMEHDMEDLYCRTALYKEKGYDVRLTTAEKPYMSDVVDLKGLGGI